LLKRHEGAINEKVREVRERLYGQPFDESPFDENGLFKVGHLELPSESCDAATAYIRRYTDFFADVSLEGLRLLVYKHSAVGRDILVEILRRLGAEFVVAGRSETFVPIDTENIDAEQLAAIQALVDAAIAEHGRIDAVVSTDGDGDRPLILGVGRRNLPRAVFRRGSGGMITAEYWERMPWWCPSVATTPSTGPPKGHHRTENAHRLALRHRRYGKLLAHVAKRAVCG